MKEVTPTNKKTQMKIKYILFDLIGTTIQDSKAGQSIILHCFQEAFYVNKIQVSVERINQKRGKTKREAIQNMLKEVEGELDLTDKIYTEFVRLLNVRLDFFKEMTGANQLFSELKEKGIKMGLGSGLPYSFMNKLIEHVGWSISQFDYISSSEDLGMGRPHPIMIYNFMEKLEITEKDKIMKIGDTIVDIQEGKNAGVLTVGVLTGTTTRERFEKHRPDFIWRDINELRSLIS